jgi:hypothetical protein
MFLCNCAVFTIVCSISVNVVHKISVAPIKSIRPVPPFHSSVSCRNKIVGNYNFTQNLEKKVSKKRRGNNKLANDSTMKTGNQNLQSALEQWSSLSAAAFALPNPSNTRTNAIIDFCRTFVPPDVTEDDVIHFSGNLSSDDVRTTIVR